MNPFARYPRRTAAAAAALLLAAACTDRSPVTPGGGGEKEPGEGGKPLYMVAVTCRADVRAGLVKCDPASREDAGPAADLVVGGQDRYIALHPGSSNYDHSTSTYELNMSVRNLIPQALGTEDGVTLDPGGVKVFLQAGPYVTSGTGSITIVPDGRGTFTASNQAYYQYNSILDPYEVSSTRTWVFQLPQTVDAFSFTAFVAAAVQFPDGWVDVVPEPMTMHPHATFKLTPVGRDAVGNAIPNQFFAWTSSDTTVATVSPTALVSTLRAGTITLDVTSGPRVGSVQLTVTGMQRIWQGDVSTDYHTRGNWENDIVPVSADTIIINNPSPNYPSLAANASVAGITVADGASLNLNSFDMTASKNVASAPSSGGITSTTGRLFLAGTAQTVSGRLPRLRVTGTYSLTANITVVAPLQVDLGRLTNSTFRIQASNN